MTNATKRNRRPADPRTAARNLKKPVSLRPGNYADDEVMSSVTHLEN